MAMHVAKIMDGLFMGSKEAAQDLNFLGINKIEGIINTTGHAVPNYASNMGYLSSILGWTLYISPAASSNPQYVFVPFMSGEYPLGSNI